ncbi:PEGA domain-containing protein [bacterium]|nr:PEGA domain-containing protein [bacterium]
MWWANSKTQMLFGAFFLLALLISRTASALLEAEKASRARPPWVDYFPAEDTENLYYIGRASEVKNEVEGFFQCFQDAKRQAVFEFGVQTQIRTESLRRLKGDDLHKTRLEEESELIELKEFRLKDSFVEQSEDGLKNIWTLYQYPKREKELEKKRISKGGAKKILAPTNVYGSLSKYKGILRIDTIPRDVGASVYLDGEKLPSIETPLEVSVNPGIHRFKIDHSQYEAIEDEVVLNPSERVERNLILVRAHGTLVIDSTPSHLEVEVSGFGQGRTPFSVTIPADEAVRVSLLSSKHEALLETARVLKNQEYHLMLKPQPKPGKVKLLESFPTGAEVRLDGNFLGKTPLHDVPVRGSFELELSLEGYETFQKTFVAEGLEEMVLDTIDLKVQVPEEPKVVVSKFNSPIEPRRESDRPDFFARFGYHLSSSPLPSEKEAFHGMTIAIETKLNTWCSFDLDFSFVGKTFRFNNSESTFVNVFIRAGIPIYIFSDHLYIEPLAVLSHRQIETKYATGATKSPEMASQVGVGGALGLNIWGGEKKGGLGLKAGYQKFQADERTGRPLEVLFFQMSYLMAVTLP